jgi:hypothetical protein
MVRKFVVATVQHLATIVDLAGLLDGIGAHAECSSVFETGLHHAFTSLLHLGGDTQLTKVGNRGGRHGRPPVVVLAGNAEGLVTVLVQLAERLALLGVERRVLNDFIAEIARVVLEIISLERGVLLLTASITIAVGMTFRVVIYNCLGVLLHDVRI